MLRNERTAVHDIRPLSLIDIVHIALALIDRPRRRLEVPKKKNGGARWPPFSLLH
jgi:hypothetical protein